VQRNTLVDLKRHDPIDYQVAHLVGIINVSDGKEVDAMRIVGGMG
jgi:hypothetical protein